VILLMALLALQTSVDPSAEDEILVIGRRFEQASATVSRDAQGRYSCSMTVTSGNVKLDERLCRAAAKCVMKGASNSDGVKTCINRQKPKLLARFLKERKKASQQ
jgi:hypothetical protein